MFFLPFNVYLDSKRVSIHIEAVLPTLPMLYLPFNVRLDSKRVSILIEAVLPTLPMLYLPFNVYLDLKRVSILIEAVWPTLLFVLFPVFSTFNLARSMSVAPAGQCRLAPLVQVILDCGLLYDYSVRLLFKLHACKSSNSPCECNTLACLVSSWSYTLLTCISLIPCLRGLILSL